MMKSLDELRKFYEKADGYEMWTPKHKAELDSIAEAIETELAERYIAMPLGADGEPIHVGDVMEFSEFEIEHPVTRTVEGIGQGTFFAWCGERGYQQHDPKRYRHHRPPTVEDVLEDMIAEAADCDTAELVERYSKLLALRGE